MAIKEFSEEQIIDKIRFENPWWETGEVDAFYTRMKRRRYFDLFRPLVYEQSIKRAVVLMGPRRVGKTVMLFHIIQDLIRNPTTANRVFYLSVENPIYNNISLEQLFTYCAKATGLKLTQGVENVYVIFDEIQYLKDWEVHLKILVDTFHRVKFIASGSAAAALRLKSNESGAGRFTDFILPPLTFYEYIDLKDLNTLITVRSYDMPKMGRYYFRTSDIQEFNRHFIDYINFGGYPEVSLSETIQADPGRYIRSDIIDKVLLRDLPSLYGIQDVRELNALFTTIAYNSGNEFTYDNLSQSSGVSKNTIKRYITYLEAAFLIRVVNRIDINAKKFKRANYFKIYLTNPSLRSALFAPITADDNFVGHMVETAIFAQWNDQDYFMPYYARWQNGEVDAVALDNQQTPQWVVEIKWGNQSVKHHKALNRLRSFCAKNSLKHALITTRDIEQIDETEEFTYHFLPASLYCYTIGRVATEVKQEAIYRRPIF